MIGKYSARLDEKSRLFVPAKLRGELGDKFFVTLGVNCGHRCLTVYTAGEWQRLSDNFNALSISQRSGATSLFFMNATECVPDKQFRFSLSASQMKYAGITRDGLILKMTEEAWDQVINVNLKGVFNVTKATIQHMMKARYGRIVTISSIVGIHGNAGQTNYAAAKAGIIGFTKSLAKELASRNINANVVAPGYVDTDMTAVLKEEARSAMLNAIPLNDRTRGYRKRQGVFSTMQ